MANFFSDNKDLQFHLQHPAMRKIVELKERGFAEKDRYDYAPQNFEDAMDSYRKVLDIAGEVCGEVIAPNAEGVDHEGPRVVNDHVEYASGTVRNLITKDSSCLIKPAFCLIISKLFFFFSSFVSKILIKIFALFKSGAISAEVMLIIALSSGYLFLSLEDITDEISF